MSVIDRRSFLKAAAAGAVATASGRSTDAIAADTGASVEAPGFYRFRLGDFHIAPLCDGMFFLPMDSIATNAEAGERKAYFDAHYMTADVFPLQTNPLLIEMGEKRILVDTGMGPGRNWAPTAGRLAKSLGEAGVTPEAIDTIVLTHCHVDHVGGLDAAATKQFPNAEVVLSETELDLWNSPDAASKLPEWAVPGVPQLQKVFASLGDRLRPIKSGADVATGIAALDTSGHTQGHISLLVGSGDEQLLITGDAVPSIHIAFDRPEWQIIWDHDREKGAKTRRALLDRAAHDRLLVAGYHYPFPGIGHVVKEGNGFRWLPVHWVWDS
ncbi:MBL fold metallo-hydrolase [Sinorhizobium meliloti]|uniref:MBL fold metallo-hydrolase n=1 Tax=Rhizobium meliloti TaxID=382 RepID=UPI00237F3335|nr:MBL fold metallo-hydrolase [Sinorhizobium meliloti]MDE3812315.1 MBL fold metallo-hydrolase [Sinorhizobium meliloti]